MADKLQNNEKYMTEIPVDPSGATATNGTWYHIRKSANGRVTVTASAAELGETIQVIR